MRAKNKFGKVGEKDEKMRPQSRFDPPFVKRERKRPEKSATVIPVAVAPRPPENAPISPSVSTASLTPLPIAAPKPMRGVDTPEPKISKRGSYAPSAYKRTPEHTYATSMRAGVSLVRSIKSCAIREQIPPAMKTSKR